MWRALLVLDWLIILKFKKSEKMTYDTFKNLKTGDILKSQMQSEIQYEFLEFACRHKYPDSVFRVQGAENKKVFCASFVMGYMVFVKN